MKKDKDGRSNIDGAMVVAASGMQGMSKLYIQFKMSANVFFGCVCLFTSKYYCVAGFATFWTGLEVAAKNITTNVAAETVTTVKHK